MKRCIGTIDSTPGAARCTNNVPDDQGTDYCDTCYGEVASQVVDPSHYATTKAPEDFIDGYIECALWSSTESDEQGNMGRPLDDNYGEEDIAPETLKQMRDDCNDFWQANEADLEPLDAGRCGHDFWLTRNRHGAGFWDRGLGEVGDRLTKAAHVYGGVDLYISDGKVHA